ncbi:MAG: hypothetical protein DPW18_17075 [Chloroflexi bacterium]|nr:hypothetical protein [Chloroflexota bacterium]MDL1941688.1 hypothetical protein [Chloroflexi bacterium CFX2]
MKQNPKFLLFILALAFSILACSIFVGGPEYPAQIVPASTEEAQTMREQIEQAFLSGAETGIVTLQITESQLTSYMADKLAQQTNPPFTDPQILLRNGQMQMYGKITRGWLTANMLITMNVTVDEATGQPKIEIASAEFGPIPAPEGLNSAVSAIIDEAFTGSFGPAAVGFRLETITIADGIMTLTGRIK